MALLQTDLSTNSTTLLARDLNSWYFNPDTDWKLKNNNNMYDSEVHTRINNGKVCK